METYAYSNNNPIRNYDSDGTLTRQYRRDGKGNELVRALEAPLREALIKDCRIQAEQNEKECIKGSSECKRAQKTGPGMGDLKSVENQTTQCAYNCIKGANCEYEACLAGATSASDTTDYMKAWSRCMRR